PERFRRYYSKLVGLLGLVTMPLAVFLGLYSKQIILVALGSKWLPSKPIFEMMAVAAFLRPVISTSGSVMLACGKSRRFFLMGTLISVVLLSCFVLAIPFGTTGIASGYAWALYLPLLPRLYWAFKDTPVTTIGFLNSIAKPLVASMVMGITILIVQQAKWTDNSLIDLVIGAAISPLVYFGTWFAMPGGRSELGKIVADIMFGLNLGPLFRTKQQTETAA
ncbi:MAG: polysaccharide biosynthesis C-terminal domain-containing protein, partial [Verrucomicrobia bacterium]|nr:polysaccharide biosynthesis C-terminal domain-containing protein [Verrucomicrobiota bacterium]